MRRGMWLSLALAAAVGAVTVAIPPAPAQTKKLVYWTHWDQQPDFNKWYVEKGKEFAKKTGYEIEVVTVPYQGYEAKYLAALMGKSGAPDFFNGMTHQWCGQYDFCDPMPPDLAKIWDESIPKYMVPIGKWKNVRYGTPLEHGNFQQMYMNVDLFKKAGLDADKPPKTLDEWLAAMKKLTSGDTQVGFALRHKGHPVGITDKFLPFAHAYGARMLSPDLEKATGFANSPEMVAALQFFGDLVLKDKVASLALGNPEDAFGQKRAAVIFRESWFFGWVHKNAPDVKFKVAALPCGKTCPGAGALFPWTNLVYKNSPNKQVAWEFIRFISNAKDDLDQHQFGGFMPVFNGEPRLGIREGPARLPVDQGHAGPAGAADVLPPEVERAGHRLRRGGRRRPLRQGAAEAAPRRGGGEDGPDPSGLGPTEPGRTSRIVGRVVRLAFPRTYTDRQRRAGFLFVLPALVYFTAVFLVPLAESVLGSFYRTRPGGASQFVGLRLYERVLTDPTFWQAVRNTVKLLLLSAPATVVLALVVALGLNRFARVRWRSVWAVLYFLPFAVSLVAAALVWQWLYEPVYGFLNHLLGRLGIGPHKWLSSLEEVLPSLALINVWVRLGFDTMIFLAALQAIPGEYYEAAAIDGAGAWRSFRSVTLPLLNPQLVMVSILELIFNFKVFDQVYATTQGGPASASQTVIMLLYDTAFKYFRLGDASVMAVFVFACLLLVTLVQWRLFRREVEH